MQSLTLAILAVPLLACFAHAGEVTIQSGPTRTSLLELFTSEGCSSCPPAENWLSNLRGNPRLWKDVVPIAFHVNYWDDLGWTDALATPAFTDRQRDYAAAWGAGNVYTPAFVLNGNEWRDRSLNAIPAADKNAGNLSATLHENGEVQVTFHPPSGNAGQWQAHAALLGLGVTSDVKAGENGGRRLVHDFVVLDLQEGMLTGDVPTAVLHLPRDKIQAGKSALAVWITVAGQLQSVQAAGGNL